MRPWRLDERLDDHFGGDILNIHIISIEVIFIRYISNHIWSWFSTLYIDMWGDIHQVISFLENRISLQWRLDLCAFYLFLVCICYAKLFYSIHIHKQLWICSMYTVHTNCLQQSSKAHLFGSPADFNPPWINQNWKSSVLVTTQKNKKQKSTWEVSSHHFARPLPISDISISLCKKSSFNGYGPRLRNALSLSLEPTIRWDALTRPKGLTPDSQKPRAVILLHILGPPCEQMESSSFLIFQCLNAEAHCTTQKVQQQCKYCIVEEDAL